VANALHGLKRIRQGEPSRDNPSAAGYLYFLHVRIAQLAERGPERVPWLQEIPVQVARAFLPIDRQGPLRGLQECRLTISCDGNESSRAGLLVVKPILLWEIVLQR